MEQFPNNLFGISAENIDVNFHSYFLFNGFFAHDFYIILALVFTWTADKVALISVIASDVGNVLFMFATMHI